VLFGAEHLAAVGDAPVVMLNASFRAAGFSIVRQTPSTTSSMYEKSSRSSPSPLSRTMALTIVSM